MVFFELKYKLISSNSTHNIIFKHGLFRSLTTFDEYMEFYIRKSAKEKICCIIRKYFVINDSKTSKASYCIHFNWNNKSISENSAVIQETNTEKFMILGFDKNEHVCFKMLEDAIINTNRKK
uniref:Uncharacterized protein n=1 Tax=Panagrolaimus sp. PS1159 TaxID=55785 RepID=A0AC35GFX5_9BILA